MSAIYVRYDLDHGNNNKHLTFVMKTLLQKLSTVANTNCNDSVQLFLYITEFILWYVQCMCEPDACSSVDRLYPLV